MPGDEYASVGGGGALKLKGAKVTKHKKKKKDKQHETRAAEGLERALRDTDEATADSSLVRLREHGDDDDEHEDVEGREKVTKDRKKKAKKDEDDGDRRADDEDDYDEPVQTEAERRHEELKRKKLLELARGGARPELLKTHKERVEELNNYLSKLSEHHDMPKIGPG